MICDYVEFAHFGKNKKNSILIDMGGLVWFEKALLYFRRAFVKFRYLMAQS